MSGMFNGLNPFSSTDTEDANEVMTEERRKAAQAQLAKSQQSQSDLYNQTKQYRDNIPGMKDNAVGAVGDIGRQNFARDLASNASAAQGRGLLYSGLKQQADQNSASDYANALSNRMGQLNNGFRDQANQMDQMTMQNGMNLYKNQSMAQDQAYKNALAKHQQSSDQFGSLAGGVGSIAGLIAA